MNSYFRVSYLASVLFSVVTLISGCGTGQYEKR